VNSLHGMLNCETVGLECLEEWTEGVIIRLHKKGDKSDVKNYRRTTLV